MNSYLDVEGLKKYVDKGREYVDVVKGMDVIMFIGNTGVGKSTTICYLQGETMVEKVIQYK